ncbi:uncharacterized protein MELLADRAFT_70805 [Melampsora larici-populina 98AG31]|uniref:Uncharacterized protein n=1 Tax=Melampsora larici-populina (strain 98AG31 / pathotype 3-4-7) TaxID=747676 RepID=F4R847_MELLP|nr:uncharacterized protein MELLADRAFT_70805 [Melampsora larici-populina 98AG31]EGG11678.1 hypothetical protein MELLADRAFT_70805 [Melampsora larici-populina 98AG31]
MTPQQISQQSKSNTHSNQIQNELKRKQSLNSSLPEISKKTRIIEIDNSDNQNSDVEKPDQSRTKIESNQVNPMMNQIRQPQTTVNRNPHPNVGSSSHNKPMNPPRAPMPAKKNPVNLFIKQKKPTRISAPREGDELDTRTTKERIADEMKTLRRPK